MFQIKICGVTNVGDAELIGASGADAVGLNFYSASRRFVTMDQAERIVATLPETVVRVGLFVNATDDEVCRVYDHLQLDMIQLHGDEPPEFLSSLGERPVLRAFRLGPSGVLPIREYLDQCDALKCSPEAVLIDAHEVGAYGGTGTTADWELLRRDRHQLGKVPLVLAGGLHGGNVAEAVRVVQPDAVDTASGVERSPGVKDPGMVRDFVTHARVALDRATGTPRQ